MNIGERDRKLVEEWTRKHPEIRAVYLYGSRARGTNRPDSDIDLAIMMVPRPHEVTQLVWSDWHEKYRRHPDLHLSHPVHLQWYEPDGGFERVGRCGVERDGILLYQAEGEDE